MNIKVDLPEKLVGPVTAHMELNVYNYNGNLAIPQEQPGAEIHFYTDRVDQKEFTKLRDYKDYSQLLPFELTQNHIDMLYHNKLPLIDDADADRVLMEGESSLRRLNLLENWLCRMPNKVFAREYYYEERDTIGHMITFMAHQLYNMYVWETQFEQKGLFGKRIEAERSLVELIQKFAECDRIVSDSHAFEEAYHKVTWSADGIRWKGTEGIRWRS